MSDIENCQKCNDQVHMDLCESCGVCSAILCSDCSRDQGFWFFDRFEGTLYVCKGCITEYKEKGMDWLKGELCEEFEEKVFLHALNKFESRQIIQDLVSKDQRSVHRYAAKYICDRSNRDVAQITDADLADCFKGCVVTARVEWFPHIRAEIVKIIEGENENEKV